MPFLFFSSRRFYVEQQPDTEQTEPVAEPTEQAEPAKELVQEAPAPVMEPAPTPVAPVAPQSDRRVALYVLASGPNMGKTVECVLMDGEFDEEAGDLRANLARVESPTVLFQTKALYSEGKEPGTWH